MEIYTPIVLLLISYFIGSISFTRIIGRLVLPGEDLEATTANLPDSDIEFSFKSVSATTLRVRAGSKYGIYASLLDMLKAAIPILITQRLYGELAYSFLVSIGVILGHDFPIYYKFRGGRGVSSLWGSLIVMNWRAIPLTAIPSLLIGLFIIDDAFFAYLSAPFYLIPWALIYKGVSQWLIYSIIVNIIYWFALFPEIREYLEFRKTDKYGEAKRLRHEKFDHRIKELRKSILKILK
jgi:glycerol-3-phosphate acyltransferase PlsY